MSEYYHDGKQLKLSEYYGKELKCQNIYSIYGTQVAINGT